MKRLTWLFPVLLAALPFTAGGESVFYTVKKGDTLFKVSREFDVPVNVLKAANRLADESNLDVGDKLTIPDAHLVQKGETLYGISRRYGVTVAEIASLNRLSQSRVLKINQKIYIIGTVREARESVLLTEPAASVFWPHPGAREIYEGKVRGILINGKKGDLLYSVSTGKVIWSGPYRGFGNVALVGGQDGLVYGYLGCEELIVSVGEQVESGNALGRMGLYFHQTDAKLLFIVYHSGQRLYLDPREVLFSQNNSNK